MSIHQVIAKLCDRLREVPRSLRMSRIFLLSPAHSGGVRAGLLTRPEAAFELALRVRAGKANVGEVFSFCSGLYFRGKLAYARHFAQAPKGITGVQVITTSRGLVPADMELGMDELREFAAVPVDINEPRFTAPLEQSVRELARQFEGEIVLLGSIATGKYVDCLLPILGQRLLFPEEFIGRGDMSRGGLMLRCAAQGEQLHYIPVEGAVRRGRRATKISQMPVKRAAPE